MGKWGLADHPFPALDLIETMRMDSSPASLFGAWVQPVFSVHFSCWKHHKNSCFHRIFHEVSGDLLVMLLQYSEWQSASKNNKNKLQREKSVGIGDIKRQGSRKEDKEERVTKIGKIREDQQKYVAKVENEVKNLEEKIFKWEKRKNRHHNAEFIQIKKLKYKNYNGRTEWGLCETYNKMQEMNTNQTVSSQKDRVIKWWRINDIHKAKNTCIILFSIGNRNMRWVHNIHLYPP